MIDDEWQALAGRFPEVGIDEFIVMPDHLHGILLFRHAVGSARLSEIVGAFKSVTTHRYAVGVREQGWPQFQQRLWQRSFYDHVIRNEISLSQIREYIRMNPIRWWIRRGSQA